MHGSIGDTLTCLYPTITGHPLPVVILFTTKERITVVVLYVGKAGLASPSPGDQLSH